MGPQQAQIGLLASTGRIGVNDSHASQARPAARREGHPGSTSAVVVSNRGVAAWDWGGVDDRGCCLAVGEKAVEQFTELVDRAQVELEVEAVFPGDAVALADLLDLGGEFGDSGQLAWGGLDADDRRQLVAEGARVDLGAIAGDDAGALETLDTLGDSR